MKPRATIILLVLGLALSVPLPARATCKEAACDPVSSQAYGNLLRRLDQPDSDLSLWLDYSAGPEGHRVYLHSVNPYLDARQQQLNKLWTWAKQLKDSRDKSAYLGWMEHYQDGLNDARREFETHKILDRQNEYDLYLERCREEERKLAKVHKVPVPPE